jgi:hypothetical protein
MVMMLLCLGLGSACDKSVYRSAEGQFCSSSDDDDPSYECLLGMGLVCASTYSMPVLDSTGAQVRFQPIWLCRQACTPGDSCFQAGDVCCKTSVYGRAYADRPYACAPEDRCDDKGDAGTKPDARITRDGPADLGDDAENAGDAPHVSPEPGSDGGTAPPDAGATDAPLDMGLTMGSDGGAG